MNGHGGDVPLVRYIEGWLQCREKGKDLESLIIRFKDQEGQVIPDAKFNWPIGCDFVKLDIQYKRLWCVLKGYLPVSSRLMSAYLFCFKDQNTHVREHFVGSYQINFPQHTICLISCKGDKPMKCEFTINLNETKLHFIADDQMSQERWIYALVDLVGKGLPPSELPTEENHIRSFAKSLFRSKKKKKNMARADTMPTTSLSSKNYKLGQSVRLSRLGSSTDEGVVSLSQSGDERQIHLMKKNDELLNLVSWYHGDKGREETEYLLNSKPVGSYLMRNFHEVGSYTLTYRDSDKIKHHIVKRVSANGYQFDMSEIRKVFLSPQEAVLFYMDMKSKMSEFLPQPIDKDGSQLLPMVSLKSSLQRKPNAYQFTTPGYQSAQLPPTPDQNGAQTLSSLNYLSPSSDSSKKKISRASSTPQLQSQRALRPKLSRGKTEEEEYTEMNGRLLERYQTPNLQMSERRGQDDNEDGNYLESVEMLEAIKIAEKKGDDSYLTDTEIEQNGHTPVQACVKEDHNYVNIPAPIDAPYTQYKNDDAYMNSDEMREEYAADAEPPPPPIPPRTFRPHRISNEATYVNVDG